MVGVVRVRDGYEEYDKYIYLVEIMKNCDYIQKDIYDKIPFKLKDVVFSSIWGTLRISHTGGALSG